MEPTYGEAVRLRFGRSSCPPFSTKKTKYMEIRAGYAIAFSVPQRTSMILMLNVHPSRRRHLVTEDNLVVAPGTPLRPYRDTFGNICTRVTVPAGAIEFSTSFVIRDSGLPDEIALKARQHAID